MPRDVSNSTWSPHGYKHFGSAAIAWVKVVEGTERGDARYKPTLDVQQIETTALSRGTLIYEAPGGDFRAAFYVSARIIGASCGEETDIVRVQETNFQTGGTFHGRPITERELLEELKSYNRQRAIYFLKRFLKRWKLNWGLVMGFINWHSILSTYPRTRVDFSIMRYPHLPSPINVTLAGFKLPNDMYVDVEWKASTRTFIATLFVDPRRISAIDNVIAKATCSSPMEVEMALRALMSIADQMSTGHAYTEKSMSDDESITCILPGYEAFSCPSIEQVAWNAQWSNRLKQYA